MKTSKTLLFILIFFCSVGTAYGQSVLNRSVTLDVNRQRLDQVLEIISNKADCYFSYSSSVVKKDSLVSLSVRNKTLKEVLALLFNTSFEFRESGTYIIIRKAPIRMTMITKKAELEDKIYTVSGYVYDEHSDAAIPDASVYEKKLLASALTNEAGFFKLKLKSSKATSATLTVSKEFYEDTSILIQPGRSQELSITLMPLQVFNDVVTISPEDYLSPDSGKQHQQADTALTKSPVPAAGSSKVERTGMGRFLLSAKQKMQTINLGKFFTTRPFQVSLVPGLGSHGQMSGQVINKFSLNVVGGYTAGTNGLEIGGFFNIDKKEVKYFQAAGVFNVVGGVTRGVQIAGVNNTVLNKVYAFQAAGVNNLVKGNFTGFQVAGVCNHVMDSVKGWQAAGVANFAKNKVTGAQVAGVINISNREMNGVQISGVINYAKKLKGVQFGLINIADSSDGYSIGLINIILKGYHKLSVFRNELTDINVAFKTGNSKFYSILQAGVSPRNNDRIYSFGYGLGSELKLNKSRTLTLNPELTSDYLYRGSWDYLNLLNKLQLNLNVKLNKYISFYAGPSYSLLTSDQTVAITGYRFELPSVGYKNQEYSNRVRGWFGWTAGISFF
ncbi:MAG: hypothetical protein HYZ15_05020 [Sphingobacteriales bacterium]|nr:hypothetical protein [Sphingobacteriales bacterium]